MEKVLMVIPNKCTGCSRCTYVCSAVKEGMFIPSKARISVNNFPHEGYSVPSICFQCPGAAACMKACPEDAIVRNERDVVVINVNKCTKCGACVSACPYGMIEQYESGVPYKCDLCGGSPACVAECNFGALVFKETDAVFKKQRGLQMRQRIKEGSPEQKRHQLAVNLLDTAVRVAQSPNYLG